MKSARLGGPGRTVSGVGGLCSGRICYHVGAMDAQGRFVAGLLGSAAGAYAAGAVERQRTHDPELEARYGAGGLRQLRRETEYRVRYLAEALAAGRPALFHDHVAWLKLASTARGVPVSDVSGNLTCLLAELGERLPDVAATRATEYLTSAIAHLASAPEETASFLADDNPHCDLARRYLLASLEARRDDAVAAVMEAMDAGVSGDDLHRDVFGLVQAELGRLWQLGQINVSEEHLATNITEQAIAAVHARMSRTLPNGRRVLVTAVGGDLHAIGGQLVSNAFEKAGWTCYYLGANTPATDLAQAVTHFAVDVLAVSVHLAVQISETADLIAAVRALPEPVGLRILVGGPPFNAVEDLWEVVGADGCARDAAGAVTEATRLIDA